MLAQISVRNGISRTLLFNHLSLAWLCSLGNCFAKHSHEVLILVSCEAREFAEFVLGAELDRRFLVIFEYLIS